MIRIMTVITMLIIVTGCASSTMKFKSEFEAPKKSIGKFKFDAEIKRKITPGFFYPDIDNQLTIYINEDLALRGMLSRDNSGTLFSNYKGKAINVDCDRAHLFADTICELHVNSKKAGKLILDGAPDA